MSPIRAAPVFAAVRVIEDSSSSDLLESLRDRKGRTIRRAQCRCVGCGASLPVTNAMSSSMGLCAKCQAKSPGYWRTVYDRERQIGQIPPNLAPVR